MELKDFIKETLVNITDGVVEAEKICSQKGANVNPLVSLNEAIGVTSIGSDSVSMIKFHVGLCSSSSTSEKSGIGVFLAHIGIGASGNESNNNDCITSIDFTIPLKLPYSNTNVTVFSSNE